MPVPEKRQQSKTGAVSWRVRYQLGGKPRSKTFYVSSAAEIFCEWINRFGPERALELLRLEQTGATRETPTLTDYFERYINSLSGASTSTKDGYRSIYKTVWEEPLGDIRLDQLNREMIAAVITSLTTKGGRSGRGYSDKSIRNQHGLLSGMLATAVRDGLLDANPCTYVGLPRRTEHDDHEPRFLTADEFARLRDAMAPIAARHWLPLLDTLVGTGNRWGEAEAYFVGDWKSDKRILEVRRSAKNHKIDGRTHRVLGPPKSRKSRRDIHIDETLAETLNRLAHKRDATERLFTAPRGGNLNHKIFWQDVWRKTWERLGEPAPRIHDLRHTHASWLVEAGVDYKVIQERLGHESITTTIDLYSHLRPDAQLQATTAMLDFWSAMRPVPPEVP